MKREAIYAAGGAIGWCLFFVTVFALFALNPPKIAPRPSATVPAPQLSEPTPSKAQAGPSISELGRRLLTRATSDRLGKLNVTVAPHVFSENGIRQTTRPGIVRIFVASGTVVAGREDSEEVVAALAEVAKLESDGLLRHITTTARASAINAEERKTYEPTDKARELLKQ